MGVCNCESSLCDHGEDRCARTDVKSPTGVQYLNESPMCDPCIKNYVEAGYGITADYCPKCGGSLVNTGNGMMHLEADGGWTSWCEADREAATEPAGNECPGCGGPAVVWADNSGGVTVNYACDNATCDCGKGPWDVPRPIAATKGADNA